MPIVLMLLCCMVLASPRATAAPTIGYRVVRITAHDPLSFTQGLAISDGYLIEGTGIYGRSRLTIHDRATGKLLHETKLRRDEFGEGVTVAGNRVIQLTWMNAVGYVYDLALRQVGSFPLSSEGWGLAYDGKVLILSDGSSRLSFIDPMKFSIVGSIAVTDSGKAVERLNELEVIDGLIVANVWQTDRLAVIDPKTGQVRAWLNLEALRRDLPPFPRELETDFVLNGVALVPENGHWLVTGKCWPTMFEIEIEKKAWAKLLKP